MNSDTMNEGFTRLIRILVIREISVSVIYFVPYFLNIVYVNKSH
jgi:hypothetical protein